MQNKLNFFDTLTLNLPKYIVIFLFIYATLPIISPIAFKLGFNDLGHGIQFIYRIFCHQRVERSMFLFGEEKLVSFYTIEHLHENGYLHEDDKPYIYGNGWEIYQYPYWGNNEIGYKVAYCIRDMGLYTTLAFTSLLIYLYHRKTGKIQWIKWYWILLLCFPMMFDGVFQTIIEIFGGYIFGLSNNSWVLEYIANIEKRWITGALFGLGFAFIIMPNLLESSSTIVDE